MAFTTYLGVDVIVGKIGSWLFSVFTESLLNVRVRDLRSLKSRHGSAWYGVWLRSMHRAIWSIIQLTRRLDYSWFRYHRLCWADVISQRVMSMNHALGRHTSYMPDGIYNIIRVWVFSKAKVPMGPTDTTLEQHSYVKVQGRGRGGANCCWSFVHCGGAYRQWTMALHITFPFLVLLPCHAVRLYCFSWCFCTFWVK